VLNLKQFLESCPKLYMDTQQSREILGKEKRADLPSLLMVITFHSLEERLVSQAFAMWKKSKLGDQATKKPCEPSEQELNENSRSQSAKLYSFLF